MSFEDERIVKMTFDNKAFQKNIESTIRALERLDKSMKLEDVGSSKAFDNFVSGADETSKALNSLDGNVSKVQASFSALQIVGYTVFAELTRYAINAGKQIYNSTLGQIKSGGLSRALNIEAAKFQIEGLGHTWESVYDDINYAVKGTAYGLDSAAKAASQLLASEIKAGDQMKVSLRGISGLAAMTNSSYDDIADIFTTVAGNGRLMGDQLNRISYRGINAAQTLKDYFNNVKGITINTEKEIRDMVAKGKVSFMDFAAAMDYAFGEHAKDANRTFTGAMSNVRAALSRIGEKFITPFNEFKRRLAVSVIPVIDRAAKGVEAILPVFNTIIERTAIWAEKLLGSYNFQKAILNVIVGIWSWIQNIIGALYELGFHLPGVENLADLLESVTSVLVLNAEQGRTVREVVKTLLKPLSIVITLIQGILYAVKPLFTFLFGSLKQLTFGDIIDKINYVIKLISVLMHIGIKQAIKATSIAIKILSTAMKGLVLLFGGVIFAVSKIAEAFNAFRDSLEQRGISVIKILQNIAKAFVKLYEIIVDVFENARDGMSNFLSTAQEKASDLWDVISGLTGKKTLTVDVDISAAAKKLDPSAVQSMSQYSDVVSGVGTAVDTAKKKIGGIGGLFSGALDAGFDVKKLVEEGLEKQKELDNAPKTKPVLKKPVGTPLKKKPSGPKIDTGLGEAYQDVGGETYFNGKVAINEFKELQKASEETSKYISKNTKSIAKSMTDMVDEISKSNGGKNNFFNFSSDDDDKKSKKKDRDKKKDEEEAAGFFDGIIAGFKTAAKNLDNARDHIAEHFGNFFNVIGDVILAGSVVISVAVTVFFTKVTSTLLNVLNVLPTLVSALNNAAKGLKYQGLGEAFRGVALALLALGAVLATIAVISKVCDYETFSRFTKLVMALIGVISILVYAVAAVTTAMAILNIIQNLTSVVPLVTRTSKLIDSIGRMFTGLGVLLGVILTSIIAIRAMAERDGGYNEIYKATLLVVGILAGVTAMIVITAKMTKGLGKMADITTFGKGGITRQVSSALGGIIYFIEMLMPLIVVMVGSIYLLSQVKDTGKMVASFAIVMSGLVFTIGSISGLAIYLEKSVGKMTIPTDKTTLALSSAIRSIMVLVNSLSLFVLSFSASIAILSMVPEEKQQFAFKMMMTQLIGVAAIIGGIMVGIGILQKSLGAQTSGLAKVAQIASTFKNIALVISSLGGAIAAITLSIVGSLAIISKIPKDKLWSSVEALAIMMGVVTIVVSVILKQMKEVSSFISNSGIMSGAQTTIFSKFGMELSKMMVGIGIILVAMSASLGVLSTYDQKKVLSASLALAGMSFVMLVFMTSLMKVLKVTGSFNANMSTAVAQMGPKTGVKTSNEYAQTMTGYMNNTGTMMLEVLGGMSVLMLAMAGAIRMLKDMEIADMFAAMGAISIGISVATGCVLTFMVMMTWTAKQLSAIAPSTNISGIIYGFVPIIFALAGSAVTLIAAVSMAAAFVDGLDPESMLFAVGALSIALIGINSLVLVLGRFAKNVTAINPTAIMVSLNSISIMIASIAASVFVISMAARMLDGVDTTAIIAGFGGFLAVIVIVAAGIAVASRFAAQITAAGYALQTMIPAIMSFCGAMLAFSFAAYIIGLVNWDNISSNIKGIITVFGSLAVLLVVMGVMAGLAAKAIPGLIALAGAVAAMVGIIGYTITKVFDAYNRIIYSISEMAALPWSQVMTSAKACKELIAILADAVDIGNGNVLKAALIGGAIYLLVKGFSILQTINGPALMAGADALVAVSKALDGMSAQFFVVAGLLALAGTMVGFGAVVLATSILIILKMVPMMASATNTAIAAVATVIATITANLKTIAESLSSLKSVVSVDQIHELIDYTSQLALLGGVMLVAGLALAVGTISFLIGAVLLAPAISILTASLDMLGSTFVSKVTDAIKGFGFMFALGINIIIASILLSLGVSIFLPTIAILLGAIAITCLALSQMEFIKENVITGIEAIGMLGGLALELIGLGLILIQAAALIGLAGLMMAPAFLLLAGTVALLYFIATSMNPKMILVAVGDLGLVLLGLVGLSALMIIVGGVLIVAGALFSVAALLFMVAGSFILLGMLSFTVALLAVWGAVEILHQIDFEGITEKVLQFGIFVAEICVVGLGLIVAGVILTIAGVFLLAASVLLSLAIVTFSVSILIGAALLLASAYVLQMAFTQLTTLWQSIDWSYMTGNVIDMLVFSIIFTIASGALLVASVLMLPAAILIGVGAGVLGTGLIALKKAFDKSIKPETLVKNCGLYLAAMGLLLVAGPMGLIAGTFILGFSTMLEKAGKNIASTVKSMADSAKSMSETVESFKNAGEMVCDGITEGIQEGKDRVSSAVEDLADGDVLGAFCDVLGIHSPAEEFVHAAANCIAGIAEGLGMDRDTVYNQIDSMGMGMIDTFGGMMDSFKGIGSQIGNVFTNGMGDAISSGMKDIGAGVLSDFNALLNGAAGAGIDAELKYAQDQFNNYQKLRQTDQGAANEYNNQQADYWDKEVQRLQKEKDSMQVVDYTQQVADMMGDWTAGGAGGGVPEIDYAALDTGTADALSTAGSGLKQTGSDASSVGGNVGTAITNNTYNFTQNNYSPEPIDRTELYTQTNNQLDTWYKWLRDNG